MRTPGVRARGWMASLWLAVTSQAVAQVANPLPPQWLRMHRPEWTLGMEVEGLREDVDIGSSLSRHEQLSLVPLLGMRTDGSIYHPNLLTFAFDGEGGVERLYDSFTSSDSDESREEKDHLIRYRVEANLLSAKPYNATFIASKDHTVQNYDAFSTYTVDSQRRSGRASWVTGDFSLSVDTGFRDETSEGLTDVSQIVEHYLNFNGTHQRETGQSTLIYRYDGFDNRYNFGPTESSQNHTVSASDSETFGSRRQGTATTGASYSQYEYSGRQTESVTANESISFNHRPKLDSFLTAYFSHSSMDPVDSTLLQGTTGIRHRLYDSLTSTLDAHGTYDTASSATSSAANDRYGMGLLENYTKRLGDWGRLSLGGGLIFDHEDHESSGSVLTTLDEKLVLYLLTSPGYRPAFLKQPRVLAATIEVRGPGGIPATENVDYQVIPTGDLTEIRLVLGSLVLRDGGEVLVNYLSLSLYNASFESWNGSAQIRLDLFNRCAVYGRANWLDNNAPPNALTETLTALVAGAEFYGRWFRAGAEYEDYDSNFSQYQAWRFFQNVTWQPSPASTLGVDFTENFYRYPDGQDQTRYQALARYNLQFSYALAWYAEGGYSFQEVLGTEQNLGSARTGLNWNWGKLNFRTGYQYNYQATLTGPAREERNRNYFFVYLKRRF